MSKEIKIGILSLVTIALMIWMYQFMKGKNILKEVLSFEVVYPDIEGLKVAAPVEINGYVVGSVSDIELNKDDVRTMLITFDVQGDYRLPTSTLAVLAADNSLVGSKKIILDFDYPCSEDNCAPKGYRFQAGHRGILEALVGMDDLTEYFRIIRSEMGPVVDTLVEHIGKTDADNAFSRTIRDLEISMNNLASLTGSLDALIKNTNKDLNTTAESMAVVSASLANTHSDMENMIRNFSTLSQDLVDANLGKSLAKTDETFTKANDLLEELKSTASKANESLDAVSEIMDKIESGKGSLAQLVNDPGIYDNLEETTRHLSLLLQDMRLNPKRYVHLSVFGRKGKPYTLPEDDPVYEVVEEDENGGSVKQKPGNGLRQ